MASDAWSLLMVEFGSIRNFAKSLGIRSGELSWAYGQVPVHRVQPLRVLLQQVGLDRRLKVVTHADGTGELCLTGGV